MKPYIIGISGESGVGKSTITEIVSLFFGVSNVTSISTDDLHKWCRSNSAWNKITHLNPDANNLELGDMHLHDLSQGKFIYRSIYNHKTGNFDPPIKIEAKQYVIIEGLHAFYTDISKELIDLKIFIDTDDSLRTHWKIIRDTEERGYKYNDVLDSINKRRFDSNKIREAQIGSADVVIKICPQAIIKCLGDKSEKIDLITTLSFNIDVKNRELFEFIEHYITEFNNFVDLSELVGNDIELCQNGGGNISVKISDKYMIIKSSGFDLKDVYKLHGYSVINHEMLSSCESKITNEDTLSEFLLKSLAMDKYKRPSMETGLHTLLKEKYVIHAHAIYITLLLCLNESKTIIFELFNDYNYEYLEYISPAFGLYDKLRNNNKSNVYFLENHGLVVSSNNSKDAYNILIDINNRAKEYIKSKCKFQNFNLNFHKYEVNEFKFNFPDAILFENSNKLDIKAASNYIKMIGSKLGKLRYLAQEDILYISNMEAEKYRKNL